MKEQAYKMPVSAILAAATFALCAPGPRNTCVVDGDTFWLEGEKVRIADINAPETHGAACAGEQTQGEAATRRLIALLNAGPFQLTPVERDRDRYGRLLRRVERGGRSIGGQLVAEGLAETWKGRRSSWCPGDQVRSDLDRSGQLTMAQAWLPRRSKYAE
jgi:micrococcal nuclease